MNMDSLANQLLAFSALIWYMSRNSFHLKTLTLSGRHGGNIQRHAALSVTQI
jgi:hypothetical protein